MDRAKVFGIGFSKSGTTSLDRFLEQVGWNVCHENLGDYDEDVADQLVNRMDRLVELYDGFQDSPWCTSYKRYADRFPDSKYILTLRPLDKWLNSMSNFGDRRIPIWSLVYGVDRFAGNETYFRDLYTRHTAEALEYFSVRPGRLLVVDIEADPHILARSVEAFLGLHQSGVSFPHANVSRRSKAMWLLKGRKWRAMAQQAVGVHSA